MGDPRDDLRLLAIFHWVLAALTALFAVFPGLYIGLGVAMLRGGFGASHGEPPPPVVGWFMIGIGVALVLAALLFAALLAVAGWFVGARRHWLYCMIVAGLACALFPFGTALGVFTIVVLSRPEVKALFDARTSAPGMMTPTVG
jgi:hypothetical protein